VRLQWLAQKTEHGRFQLCAIAPPSMDGLWSLDSCAAINGMHAINEAASSFL
jgi:hypothetical protein